MNILVLKSETPPPGGKPRDDYGQQFSGTYADKVIGNLIGDEGFCRACGPDCVDCRKPYGRRFGEHIAEVITFPSELPHLIERPGDYGTSLDLRSWPILMPSLRIPNWFGSGTNGGGG